MSPIVLSSLFLILVAATSSRAQTEDAAAAAKSAPPFSSEEDFDYAADDGGLLSFAEPNEFIGLITRPFGVTPPVRSIHLYHLKDSKALTANAELCKKTAMDLHGMGDKEETEFDKLETVELFRSRFGQACEVLIRAKPEHVDTREFAYNVNVIKGRVLVFKYKSRAKITDKERADFRKFLKSLK